MAARKPNRKKQPPPSPWEEFAGVIMRPGVVGSALVLVAVFTMLSLLTGSRGNVSGAWVDGLRSLVGVGAWLAPIVAGGLGLWMVIRAMEHAPTLPWTRPVGLGLMFIAIVVGASLLIPSDLRASIAAEGNAGGWLGTQIANILELSITSIGAWALVVFLFVSGLILFTERLLIDITAGLWARSAQVAQQRPVEPVSGRGSIQPEVPLPRGEIPLWKYWRERLFDRARDPAPTILPPSNLVTPEPAIGRGQPPVSGSPPTLAPGQQAPTQPLDRDIVTPRIIGGAQEWRLPRLSDMLNDWERRTDSDELIREQGRAIQDTLSLFGVPADFEGAYKGPSVTQYLIKPGYVERNIKGEQTRIKVKVAKIAALANDLALALAAPSVRIEAPIPGTNYVGVEVPNRESNVVGLKELMESETFVSMKGRLKIALGEDVKGQAVIADLARMPHLLIAGATGSGKSVCINSIIVSLLVTHTPDSLRLLMIDPKMVELSVYNGAPHLLSPVVTEVDKAAQVLYWAVKEMERRYTLFSKAGARDLVRYNEYLTKRGEKPLPTIVVIVDEMADLMMAAPEEVEKHICRLAQMARATGIHLVIATQRPSVDVITGLIKANFPSRIAFAVTSQIDSRVILDVPGAERLLGRGDMLFMAPDASKLERLQGTFLSDEEINRVVRYWKGIRLYEGSNTQWDDSKADAVVPGDITPATHSSPGQMTGSPAASSGAPPVAMSQPALFEEIEAMKIVDGRDGLFDDAARIVREEGRGSVSLLQRKLRIGYGRASRLVEQLEDAGVLGPDLGGGHGREVLPDQNPPPMPPPSIGSPSTGGAQPRIVGSAPDAPPQQPRVWM
jgi:S-DNA-T family DNA segregation ATPase FtsK/SpoIIIE